MMNILAQFASSNLGFAPVGEIRMLTKGSDNAWAYYRDKINEANLHTSIQKAYAATVAKRNDIILVTPDSHAWKGDTNAGGEALTWSKANTHLLGLDPASQAGYNRARFSHAGYTMANFMTVSSDQSAFKHLRFMHGSSTGGAADVTCITVTGNGNCFEFVAFAGPNDATQAGSANHNGVIVSGSHNYFKNCMFGSVNDIDRAGANNSLLEFSTDCGAWNIFDSCTFRSRASATTPIFINDAVTNTVVDFTALFFNCQFINAGGSTLAVGITKAATAQRKLYFDNRCSFVGVTQVVTAGREGEIFWGGAGVNSDTTAIHDRKALGIGLNPVAP